MLVSTNPTVMNAIAATRDDAKTMVIKPSPSASASTATHRVGRDELRKAVHQHRRDVRRGMERIADLIRERGSKHDWTKLEFFDKYYDHFSKKQDGFDTSEWARDYHNKYERHHIEDGARPDINLIDIIEHLVDGVVSGKGRGGEYKADVIGGTTLFKAFQNTQKMIEDMVEVK